MSRPSETSVVSAWHDALNAGDVESLVDLSHPDILLGGPRGSASGTRVLREWVGRAGIQLCVRRIVADGETVVVEQDAIWSSDMDSATRVASVFVVRDSRVASVVRFPDMDAALEAAGLDARAYAGAYAGAYEAAGVSIERGERAVDLMRAAVERTHGREVIGGPGGFAGIYALGKMREPVLASTIDGVGTKVLVARETGAYATLGEDIVNHCANDVLATGARPLLFMDYIAAGRLDPEAVANVVNGAANACERLGIALIGGETAEMPGLYAGDDLDIVGACVGACDKAELVSGEEVRPGNVVIGLASSGLHTNGYSLARRVVEGSGVSWSDVPEGFEASVAETYLEPHRAYVREVEALRAAVRVRGMAHVTGGGLPGNLPRALGGFGARVRAGSWEEPAVFGLVRELGAVPEDEMRRVFNVGVGFCCVVASEDLEAGLAAVRGTGCAAWRIGEVVEGDGVAFV